MSDFNVISQSEASKIVIQSQGGFIAWLGAGVSAEAGVATAEKICEDESLKDWQRRMSEGGPGDDPPDYQSFCETTYGWSRRYQRYSSVLLKAIPNETGRVKYFRTLLRGRQPSFAHYAISILMQNKILHSTCVTTNFDKLIEKSFIFLGESECQPIRAATEDWFLDQDLIGQFYCLKMHGDYDTNNILNTSSEIRSLPEWAAHRLRRVAQFRGLLVLGAGGYEMGVRTTVQSLAGARSERILEQGLLWGVFIGGEIGKLTASEREQLNKSPSSFEAQLVKRAISSGEVSSEIAQMMEYYNNATPKFAFFPVRGSGDFLLRMLSDPAVPQAVRDKAAPYQDAEMRTRSLFMTHKLPSQALETRLENLKVQRERLKLAKTRQSGGDWIEKNFQFENGLTTTLCYGDLSDLALLRAGMSGNARAAVLSPDDTFISIGGGAALAIATASGQLQSIIHDISKFVPVAAGDVVVTSAGNLPVHYIFHGASLVVQKDGKFKGTEETVRTTINNALLRCTVLGVNSLFVPLLASGAGGIGFDSSAQNMLAGIRNFINGADIRVIFVVFQEKDLLRTKFMEYAGEAGGKEKASS